MRYIISDIHGEYELLMRLLESISFSEGDVLYVCGDMIDKGGGSVRVLDFLLNEPNVRCIQGNHELSFLNYAEAELARRGGDYSAAQRHIGALFSPRENLPLDEQTFRKLQSLPFFAEEEDFICVHAGLPLDGDGHIVPPSAVRVPFIVQDRNFMHPEVVPRDSKCVCFGHTPVRFISGRDEILAYRRNGARGDGISSYYKVHLDTGVYLSGVLGCFCADDGRSFYVRRQP